MPSPMLPLAWSQQQNVKEQARVCRSAFYGMPEDLTMETGESKPTRVCLSCLAVAKTWSKVWCTSHGRRAGDDGTRHARSERAPFWLVRPPWSSLTLTTCLLERAIFTRSTNLNLDH